MYIINNYLNSNDLAEKISKSLKKTPCKVTLCSLRQLEFTNCKVFNSGSLYIIYGDYKDIYPVIEANKAFITDYMIENDARNTAVGLINKLNINARIEPGAIIRKDVVIGDNAIVMMGAIINIGAVIGEKTMIDMGAIIGARAIIGKRCHIGAGAVIAGVIEPPSAMPAVIEDDVLIGANAVIIEGVKIGSGAVVAAGSVCISDVQRNAVVAGMPAKVVKMKDEKTSSKIEILDSIRTI